MERSMVHELNGLASSQFMNNRSTFISTAFNEGDFQLRKSRIQNLPSYRREDMSSKINFVVVFQSIEIQRLSNEVEALRVALKDAQRQNFNMHNYQIQIRELNEKCFSYEREREEYREEIDKLNMICEKLYEQLENMKTRFADIDPTIKQKYRLERERTQKLEDDLEKWRIRYNAMETSKSREMQDMRLMMESQRKSMMDREIKELTLRFSTERQNLQKEIRKLREGQDSKQVELQRANGRISQLQIQNHELKQYQHTIDEYENKFAMITQQTMRLNDVLRNKQEEIDKLNMADANYRRKIDLLQKKLREAEEGGQKARALENQIRQWRIKVTGVEQLNKKYKQELDQIPEFKQVIQQINTQSERLKDAVRQKMNQVDDWKGRYQKVQTQFRENKAQQQRQIPQLENKLNQLAVENDRLNSALKTRATEIQSWRSKHSDLEKQLLRLAQLQNDKKNLQSQLNNHIRQNNELQGNIRQLQVQVRRIGDIEKELNMEKTQRMEGKKQIDRLNNAIRNTSDRINDYERKCANLQRDLKSFTQIQQELRVYKQKQINFTKQIDRINGVITQKTRQIQALKETFMKFQNRLGQYQSIQKKLIDNVNQTQKLIQDLDQSRKQNGFIQDKLLQSQAQSKKLKNDVFVMAQEKEQVVRLINTRTQQLQSIRSQMGQLQGQISQLRQKEARLRQIEEQLRQAENRINESERKFKSEQNRSRDLNNNLQQVNAQLNKIKREGMMSPKFKEEFYELRVQTQQRERQFRSLQQRIVTIEGIIKRLKETIIKQDQTVKRNHEKFGVISRQFDASAQAMKKMFELQSEIMKLNEENMQLEGKVKIMGIENETFKRSFNSSNNPWELQVGTPIEAISAKRADSFSNQYEAPTTKKSSSYTNMVISNVRPANIGSTGLLSPSSREGQGQNFGTGYSNTSTNNFNFGMLPGSNATTVSRTQTSYSSQSYSNNSGSKSKQPLNQGSTGANNFQFRTSNRDF